MFLVGLTIGLNEFAGYGGVALAGLVTAYPAAYWLAAISMVLSGAWLAWWGNEKRTPAKTKP